MQSNNLSRVPADSKSQGTITSGSVETNPATTAHAKPEPRRHHFVPEMLQRRFVDGEGRLHVFTTKILGGRVFSTHPGKLFVESRLYSKIDANGVRDTTMEDRLSAVEDKVAPVIEKIVESARAGRLPGLRPDELEAWLLFFMLQWKRVPDLHLAVMTEAEVSAFFDALIEELRQIRPDRAEELDRLDRPEVRRRMIQNARVDALAYSSKDVLEALHSRGVGIARIGRRDKQFVLASRPVVKLTHPGKTHVRHPECEMWLALAPDVIVGLGPGPGREKLVELQDSGVIRNYNLACVAQSSMFASASRDLVLSLARPR